MKAVYLEEAAVNQGDLSLEPLTSLMETVVYRNTTEQDKFEHIGDARIVYSNKVIFDEETFAKLPELKYIGVCATGYNVIDLEAAARHGVTVTNVPAYSTESVVQLTWGFILECASHIGLHNASVHRGDWVRAESFCYWLEGITELSGRTIGIVGFGNIGRRVAEIARAFHMNVLIHTAHPEKYTEEPYTFVSLEELFEKVDILTLHCPMTEATKELISAANIARMKKGVIVINVSRGGLVNEADLAEALRTGRVASAAVDVVSREPMAPDNPLLTAPNLVITPHIGWASLEARERLIETVAENVKAYLAGERLNVITP